MGGTSREAEIGSTPVDAPQRLARGKYCIDSVVAWGIGGDILSSRDEGSAIVGIDSAVALGNVEDIFSSRDGGSDVRGAAPEVMAVVAGDVPRAPRESREDSSLGVLESAAATCPGWDGFGPSLECTGPRGAAADWDALDSGGNGAEGGERRRRGRHRRLPRSSTSSSSDVAEGSSSRDMAEQVKVMG